MLGKFCGNHTLKSTFKMARRLPKEVLLRIGCKQGKAPAYTVFTTTMQAVDAHEVRLVFATAVRGFGLEEDEVVAIDGKALRGSGSHEDGLLATRLLAAFSTRLQGVIGEVVVPENSNEITAMLDLLDKVDLSNMIITGDAIFTQKEICNKIVEKNADFVFTVKDNQPRLRHKIEGLINAAEAGFPPANKRSSNHKRRSRKA
jgi:predicted transposase YbfD/YdcC